MTIADRLGLSKALLLLRRIRPGQAELILLPGLVCGAVGVVMLGSKSLWLDESVSVTLAGLGWRDLAGVLVGREANMALYHLTLKAWTGAFGTSEVAVRSLSVLCVAAAASALSVLAARLVGARAAAISGLLFALNPVVLVLAQTARGYALCLLLVVVAEMLLVDAVQRCSRAMWIAHAVVTAGAIYTNALVVLLPVANLLALAAQPRSVVRRRDVTMSMVLLFAVVSPLLLRIRQVNADGVGWIADTGGGRIVRRLNETVPAATSTSLLIITIIGVLAVVVHRRRSRPDWPARLAPVLLTAWLVTPLIGVLVLTIAYRPLLVPRYLGYCLPPLVVLVAAALVRLRAAAMVAGLSMALLLSLAFDLTWYRAGPKEGWRPLVAEVAARRGVADEILFYPAYSRLPFDYYQSRFPGGAVMEPVYPAQASGVGGGLAALGPVPIGRSVVAASAQNVPRLWLVVRRDQAGPSTREQAIHAGLGDAGLVAVRQACYGRACYAEYQRPGWPAI